MGPSHSLSVVDKNLMGQPQKRNELGLVGLSFCSAHTCDGKILMGHHTLQKWWSDMMKKLVTM